MRGVKRDEVGTLCTRGESEGSETAVKGNYFTVQYVTGKRKKRTSKCCTFICMRNTLNPFQTFSIYLYIYTHTHIFLAIHLIPKYHFCFTESSIINIWNKTSVRYCATKVSLMVQLVLVLLASYMMSQLCNFHINNVLTVYIHSGNLSQWKLGANKATQNPVKKLYFSILKNSLLVPCSIKANL